MNVENYMHEKEVEELHDSKIASLEFESVKVSLNLDENLDRRIRYVSSELGLKRSEFMRDLMNLALNEFENHLNLDSQDFDQPYANYVYAGMEEFKIGPFTFTKEQFIEMVKSSKEKEEEKEDGVTNE